MNTIDIVRDLLSAGMGRRRIAKKLGITEWKARELIEKALKNTRPIKEQVKKTRFTIKNTQPPELITTDNEDTEVKIISNNEEKDIPSSVIIRKPSLKVGVISDVHYPYEDRNCVTLAKLFLQDYNPDIVVFNGDMADCYSISTYQKDVSKKIDIQEEYDYTRDRLEEWVSEFPNTKFIYVSGNHEARLSKLVKNTAPALASLRSFTFQENVGLKDLGIQWVHSHEDLIIGNLLFYHSNLARKGSGMTAKANFEQYGCSIIVGHIHRLGTIYKRNKFGTHVMIENGTLCDFDVEYTRYPDWQHGFTTVNFDGDDFSVNQYPIINYKIITDNKVYKI